MTTLTTNNTTNNAALNNKNTNEEMVNMMSKRSFARKVAKRGLNVEDVMKSEVLTKALKTALVKEGIKFPSTLIVYINKDGNIATNAAGALKKVMRSKGYRDVDGKKVRKFPFDVVVKSANRIKDVLRSQLFIDTLAEMVAVKESKVSIIAGCNEKELAERSVALKAARDQFVRATAPYIAARNINKKIVKVTVTNYSVYRLDKSAEKRLQEATELLERERYVATKPAVFDAAKYVRQARKNIMRKDLHVYVNVIKVSEDKDGNFNTAVLVNKMDENEAIRKGFIKPCTVPGVEYNARFGNSSYATDKFSQDILVVDLSQATKSCFFMMDIFVWWNGEKSVFAVKQDGKYVDLITNKEVNRKRDPKIYKVIGGSPSALRKCQVLAFNVTEGMGKIDAMLDVLTEGAYSKEYGKKITAQQLAKYVTRFFSWTAPNKEIGKINHPAIYMGKWAELITGSDNKDDGAGFVFANFYAKCISDITGIKISAKDVIGNGVQCRPYSAKVFAPVVEERLFEVLCYEANLKFNGNGVVYIPNDKVTVEISKKLDDAFHGVNNEYYGKVIVFGEEGCEPEFMSDLNGYKTVFNWGSESGFRVLDIAKSGIAHTSIQMWEVPLDSDPKGATILMKQLRKEMFGEIFEDLFMKREVKVPSLVDIEKNFFPHNVVKNIAPDFVLDKDVAMFHRIVEEFATRDNNASNKFKWEIDGEYARLTGDISLLCSKLGILQYGEGFSPAANKYFANGDNTEKYFGCSARVREQWGKRIVSMFKYPKMGRREFYKFTAVSIETIENRVKALNIDASLKDAIIRWFKGLKDGILVVPGTDLLKQQCAGLDFDYDGATCIFDCRFNALLSDEIYITNIVLKERTKKTERVFVDDCSSITSFINKSNINKVNDNNDLLTAENLHNAYLTYLTTNSDGWSVGSITNCNSTQLAVLQIAKATNEQFYYDLMATMLGKWFAEGDELATGGSEGYKGLPKRVVSLCNDYDSVFLTEEYNKYAEAHGIDSTLDITLSTHAIVTDVSPSTINAAVEEMKNADWSNREIITHIFEDLNEIFRFYQEIIIDSAKTGESVKVIIAPGRNYHALMINNNEIKFTWDFELAKSAFEVKIKREAPSASKQGFKDLLFRLRTTYLANDLTESIDVIFKNKECKFKMKDLEVLANKFTAPKYRGLNVAFAFLKKLYGDATANLRHDKELAGDSEELLEQANKKFKKQVKEIANMGRRLTSNMSLYVRGAYVKFVSAFSIDANGNASPTPNGGNNFGANVFQQEYMAYVIQTKQVLPDGSKVPAYAKIDFCGEKLCYNALYQDGDVITLDHGINEYAVTTANLTGEFTVKEFNGEYYVTKPVMDVLPPVEIDNSRVTFRVNKETERSFEEIFNTLKIGMEVELHANHTDFGVYNNAGELICKIDEGRSEWIRSIINGVKGKITNITYDKTKDLNGRETEFIIITVA